MGDAAMAEIHAFLEGATPEAWLQCAEQNLPVLLVDHANCELKAAQSAQSLMWRYGMPQPDAGTPERREKRAQGQAPAARFHHLDRAALLQAMSRLAREELRHFEQVLALLQARGIPYGHVPPSRYAAGLRRHVRTREPGRLVDTLIAGAFIEARSCERFAALVPRLDRELARFYSSLLKSEARHYRDYLGLARAAAGEPIDHLVDRFRAIEAELIASPDEQFRFHSGVPG